MSMTIAIDAYKLDPDNRNTSGAKYIEELINSLSVNPNIKTVYLCVPTPPAKEIISYYESEKVKFLHPKRVYNPNKNYRNEFLWFQFGLLDTIRKVKNEIQYFIFTYHQAAVFLDRKIKAITVIHDLCPRDTFLYPKNKKGYYRHSLNYFSSLWRTDRFIPISEFTRSEFLRIFPTATSRTSDTVYNKISCTPVSVEEVDRVLESYSLERNSYFFSIGSMDKRKSFDLIVDSYKSYKAEGGKAKLVMVVGKFQYENIKEVLSRDTLLSDLILKTGISNVERDSLYGGAISLLFPSRCEGFGYPILEAMVQGCPSIALKNSPAREILGSDEFLFDRLKVEDIKASMHKYEGLSKAERINLASFLRERAEVFLEYDFGKKFYNAMIGLKGETKKLSQACIACQEEKKLTD
jgi:glycosyltransferase involved in cell wall biosynthesis